MGPRKLTELMRKQSLTPRKPIRTPATEGPTTAAPLNTEELRAVPYTHLTLPTNYSV